MKQPTDKRYTISDKRYTLTREFCGYPTAQLIVRFCGEWLGVAANADDAQAIIAAHHNKLLSI